VDERSPHEFEDGAVDDRVLELCRRGLEKYRQGDVADALVDWNRARGVDPHASLPKLYIERAAHGLDPESGDVPSGLPPLGAEPRPEDDDDEGYLEVEVTSGGESASDGFLQAAEVVFALNEIDAGWSLDEEEDDYAGGSDPAQAPEVDAPPISAGVMGLPAESVQSEDEPEPLGDTPGAGFELAPPGDGLADQLELEAPPGAADEPVELELAPPGAALGDTAPAVHDSDSEVTVPGGVDEEVSGRVGLSTDALDALGGPEGSGPEPEDTTVERPGIVKRGLALPDLGELDRGAIRHDDRHDDGLSMPTLDFRQGGVDELDDELTVERRDLSPRAATEDEATMERGAAGLDDAMTVERGAAAIGDDDLTRERRPDDVSFGVPASLELGSAPLPGDGDWDEVCDKMREQVAGTLPPDATGEEQVRQWVGAFIDRARLELDRGEPVLAVTALELALSEQPESVVAQKLIHRHIDLLIEIYQAYLNEPSRVPSVAVPMHELSAHSLDNRSAFLLSRIDGTFSIEEILDVSGMTNLETYRHLCKLLLKGILELR
jgi:hypothetical protein